MEDVGWGFSMVWIVRVMMLMEGICVVSGYGDDYVVVVM